MTHTSRPVKDHGKLRRSIFLPMQRHSRRPHPSLLRQGRRGENVEADFAVELGAEDERLEFPWAGADRARYYDLKRQPELLALIEEARELPALGEFLVAA